MYFPPEGEKGEHSIKHRRRISVTNGNMSVTKRNKALHTVTQQETHEAGNSHTTKRSFVQLVRSSETKELMRDKNDFMLLALIA